MADAINTNAMSFTGVQSSLIKSVEKTVLMEPDRHKDPPGYFLVEEKFTVEVPMVRPKPLFLEILRLAGARGEMFTKDEIINYLRIYIKDRQLYDVNQPRIVHCSTDLLGAVFGVDKFAAEDVLKILEDYIVYTQDTCLKTKTQLVKKPLPYCNVGLKDNESIYESSLSSRDHHKQRGAMSEIESFSGVRHHLKYKENMSKIKPSTVRGHLKHSESAPCQSSQNTLKKDNLKTIKSVSETECSQLEERENLKTIEIVSETNACQTYSISSTSNRDNLEITKSASETVSNQSCSLETEGDCLKSNKTISEAVSCYPSSSCSQTTKELSSSETDINCLSEVSVSSQSVSSGNSGKKRKRRKRKASVIAICSIPKQPKKDDTEFVYKKETQSDMQPRQGPSISISRCSSGEYIYDVEVTLHDDGDNDDTNGVFCDGDEYQSGLTENGYDVDRIWYLNEGYVEEDLTSEPPFSESDLSSIRSGEDLLVVCQDSDVEFFADCSDSDSNADDKELTEADNWMCVDCQLSNPPYQRFCNKCWKHRPDWLPITPKTLSSLPSSEEVETGKLANKVIQLNSFDLELPKVSSGCSIPLQPEKAGLYEIRRSFSNLQPKDLSIESSETQGSSQENQKFSQLPLEDPCIICLAKPKTASLIHGNSGHQVCCFTCARQLKNQGKACPVCRRPINKVVKNYIL